MSLVGKPKSEPRCQDCSRGIPLDLCKAESYAGTKWAHRLPNGNTRECWAPPPVPLRVLIAEAHGNA